MINVRFDHKSLGYNNDEDRMEYACDIYGQYNKINKCVGYCKYYSIEPDRETVYIEFINISGNHRRCGYATKMVRELLKKYSLQWDYKFTKDGRQWFESLIDRNII
jgi:ribosomal protein S18 acetylase RimI-like enzyme